MNIGRMTIGRKLGALAGTGLVVASIIGGAGLLGLDRIDDAQQRQELYAQVDRQLSELDRIESDAIIAKRDALLAFDVTSEKLAQAFYEEKVAEAQDRFQELQRLDLSGPLATQVATMAEHYQAWLAAGHAALPTLMAMRPGTAQALATVTEARKKSDLIEAELRGVRADVDTLVTTSRDDARSSMAVQRWLTLGVMLGGAVVLVLISMLITRQVTRPIAAMVQALQALARKDLSAEVTVDSHDEIGDMAVSLNEAFQAVREAVATLADSSTTLATASEELGAVSAQLGQNAEETSSRTGNAADSAQHMAGALASMSTATEQMNASINEIAGQAMRASTVAQEAVTTAAETSDAVRELDRASEEIGEIVRVITTIAEQTNLLALNATIEAARAGDAGKGFAVVASEVKELAQETARATDDITTKIQAIQQTTGLATETIGRITSVISQINENQTTIAAAVEEQTATTTEISRNVGDVSQGSTRIADSVEAIARSASDTSQGADAARASAEELSGLAQRVKALVDTFTL